MNTNKQAGLTRRNFVGGVGAAIAGMSVFPSLLHSAESLPGKPKPNIIFLLADDLGYNDLSCYGQKQFKTPNIDGLAADGIKLTDYYSGSALCAPSRCCLMTGLHTGHAYIRDNKNTGHEGSFPIPKNTMTVARMLQSQGYSTGGFGKWGLGGPVESNPLDQGFDEFYGYLDQKEAHTYFPDHLWHNREKVELDGKTYSHDLITQRAFQFIEIKRENPFFCYMPVTIPHMALQAPEKDHKKWRKVFPEFDSMVSKYTHGTIVKNPVAGYAAMITHLDEQVGELLALLKKMDVADSTLIVFTSDNGAIGGSNGLGIFKSNSPFKGVKAQLFEGGIRAPFVARWLDKIKPGTVSNHISASWDILPTFAEISEASTPSGLDGISMLPTLIGAGQQQQHDYLYWELINTQSIRRGKWKAIRKFSTSKNSPIALYDLSNDIKESKDVAPDNPKIVARMRELFQSARIDSPIFPLEAQP